MTSLGTSTRKYKEEVEEEREALKEELRSQIRAQLFTEVTAEVQKTFERARPPKEEKAQALDLLRELEFDSMAYARACNTQADALVARAAAFKPYHRAFIYVLSVGLLPFIYFGGHRFHWIVDGSLTSEAWFTVLPAVVALGLSLITYFAGVESVGTAARNLRARAKLYTDVYEGARHARKVRANFVNRSELNELTASFVSAKQQADSGEGTELSPALVDKARQEVRDLLVVEVDPEKLWRVAAPVPPDDEEETPSSDKAAHA